MISLKETLEHLLYIDVNVLLLYTHCMKRLPSRRWDWPSIILLILMLQVATVRLVITRWTDFLYFAQTLAALGLILGIALGYSRFKRRAVILLALGYSLMLIPWQLTVAIDDELLSARLASVGGRLYFSLVQFFQRKPVDDTLLFVAFITTLVWFLSLISGYWWTRHENYLVAVLPGGVFILVIHLYDQFYSGRVWLLAVYLLFALLLLGYQYYLKNRESWRERRVFLMQESSFDLTRGMVIAASLFIFIAWTVPASQSGFESAAQTWRRLTAPWRDMQEWFSNAVEALKGPAVRRPEGDFYGNQLGLGNGNPLSEQVVFSVEAPDLGEEPPRYYWRGYVYDLYQNYRWYATGPNSEEYSPSEPELAIPDSSERIKADFTFNVQLRESLLYTPSQPLWISRPGRIQYETTIPGEKDLFAWAAVPSLVPGEQYKVTASLADPSIQQLQAAGTDYPQWVTDRYLQLPENFSTRVSDLAKQITQDPETPYDKATSITAYLRHEIKYANPLPESPPTGQDPIEWVLFDLKQGFCNYDATAEVLMLRSVGIPARMAVGFAQGTFDSETNVYIVRSLDAHAWPEVYFPGIGWIEFEPTGNQDPLERPDRPKNNSSDNGQNANGLSNLPGRLTEDSQFANREQIDEGITPQASPINTFNPLPYYLATVLLVGIFWYVNTRYAVIDYVPVHLKAAYERNGGHAPAWLTNWARWATLTPIERSFETVNRSLRLLGEPPTFYATPVERAKTLIKKLPVATNDIETLLEQHQASLFTPAPGHVGLARRASLKIWFYTLQNKIQKILYGPPIE
jgi:transglutaminase-like putative cysteine protease